MTLHTINSLSFQVKSVDRLKTLSSEILSWNSSDVTQTRQHSNTYSGFIQMQFYTSSSSGNPTPVLLPKFKTSENSSRVLQVTDVNLSLVQFLLKTSENSLWILPNNGC